MCAGAIYTACSASRARLVVFASAFQALASLVLPWGCRCSTHTRARRRRLPRCRFVPPRPNRHLLCGAAAAPSSPQSNISTLASFASRRHFFNGPRLGPPRVSSGSLPSAPFWAHWKLHLHRIAWLQSVQNSTWLREARAGDTERRRAETRRTYFLSHFHTSHSSTGSMMLTHTSFCLLYTSPSPRD